MKNSPAGSVVKLYALVLCLLVSVSGIAQINPGATEKTKMLYQNLRVIQDSKQFLFGQEFFNSFRFSSGSAHGEKEYSDSKTVTGAHPAVLGSDFHYYLEKTATEKGYHTEAVKWAFTQGYAITFDWHLSARGTTSYQYTDAVKNLVNEIVSNTNGSRDWLYAELDKVIAIINNDLVVGGERIPIVFRPWHEMNGDWFWWGSNANTTATYRELYRITVEYVMARTTSVMFCWSPNSPINFDYYPGDEYVDFLGVDSYEVSIEGVRQQLAAITDYAQSHSKVAVFSETGNRVSNPDNVATYWNNVILPAIADDPSGKAGKIAWVLTWINSSWSYPYVPHSGSGTLAKTSFINFKNSFHTLFGDEISDLYLPLDLPVDVEEDLTAQRSVEVFPVPSNGMMTIRLVNFRGPVTVAFVNAQGHVVSELITSESEIILDLEKVVRSGLHLIRATDPVGALSKKIAIYYVPVHLIPSWPFGMIVHFCGMIS